MKSCSSDQQEGRQSPTTGRDHSVETGARHTSASTLALGYRTSKGRGFGCLPRGRCEYLVVSQRPNAPVSWSCTVVLNCRCSFGRRTLDREWRCRLRSETNIFTSMWRPHWKNSNPRKSVNSNNKNQNSESDKDLRVTNDSTLFPPDYLFIYIYFNIIS